jgi:hypothetical protein
MRTLAVVLNCAIFALAGYTIGHYKGVNETRIDQTAINEAVYQAMLGELQ